MIFGKTMEFKQSDSKNFKNAVLSEKGRKSVEKTDEILKRSNDIDLTTLGWNWLKVDDSKSKRV